MRHTLSLEWIGFDQRWLTRFGMPSNRPWVARITIDSMARLDREFVEGQLDGGQSNSTGSRGMMLYFHLHEGFAYECFAKESWSSRRRWFVIVEKSGVREVSEQDMRAWLRSSSALPY